jgi:hypothetical protein
MAVGLIGKVTFRPKELALVVLGFGFAFTSWLCCYWVLALIVWRLCSFLCNKSVSASARFAFWF